MNKVREILFMFNIILMLSATAGTQFLPLVEAKQPEAVYNSLGHFTQIHGTLDGANYELLMPDNWNGRLIIACRGYQHIEPEIGTDIYTHPLALGFVFSANNNRRGAFAWSTYGEGGWCIDAGMIRTHQLTEYLVENYNVPEQVLLIGYSMGGAIACLLAEKYPDLYDGVLDICGVKDMASLWSPGSADMEIEMGGTPETKQQAYERRSPTYHADITIPIISMIGELDNTVPISQADMYYDAVDEAGCLDYYRSYKIIGGGHCDGPVWAMCGYYFSKLLAWVVSGTGPAATPPPVP